MVSFFDRYLLSVLVVYECVNQLELALSLHGFYSTYLRSTSCREIA